MRSVGIEWMYNPIKEEFQALFGDYKLIVRPFLKN